MRSPNPNVRVVELARGIEAVADTGMIRHVGGQHCACGCTRLIPSVCHEWEGILSGGADGNPEQLRWFTCGHCGRAKWAATGSEDRLRAIGRPFALISMPKPDLVRTSGIVAVALRPPLVLSVNYSAPPQNVEVLRVRGPLLTAVSATGFVLDLVHDVPLACDMVLGDLEFLLEEMRSGSALSQLLPEELVDFELGHPLSALGWLWLNGDGSAAAGWNLTRDLLSVDELRLVMVAVWRAIAQERQPRMVAANAVSAILLEASADVERFVDDGRLHETTNRIVATLEGMPG